MNESPILHFSTKNALFRHLRTRGESCLSPDEYQLFLKTVVNRDANCERIVVLYGYIPSDYYLKSGFKSFGARSHDDGDENTRGVYDGNHAAKLVLEAINHVSYDGELDEEEKAKKNTSKANRSYGNVCRTTDAAAQDECTGALTEVLTTKAPPLLIPDNDNLDEKTREELAVEEWTVNVNDVLTNYVKDLATRSGMDSNENPGRVVVFGRLVAPKKFNAEMDYGQRRIDYVIPADMLFDDEKISCGQSKQEFFDSMESFTPGFTLPYDDHVTFKHLASLKKVMSRFCTQVVDLDINDEAAVLAKELHRKKRMKHGKGAKSQTRKDGKRKQDSKEIDMKELMAKVQEQEPMNNGGKKSRVLKRRRFHNFTERLMAHEFLAYRRFDRFFHMATIRTGQSDSRPYVVLSLKGDLFLSGQARAIIGLLIAICRGYIHEDILACVFDEEYTPLVPMPFAPTTGLIAAAASYVNWEGKMKAILLPRDCNRYDKGWNSKKVLAKVDEFKSYMYECITRSWGQGEKAFDAKDLPSTKLWYNDYLEPWAKRANEQLKDYRTWKKQTLLSTNEDTCATEVISPSLSSISSDVPMMFEKVLSLLRQADSSGAWPSTTPKRKLVMVSTSTSETDNGEEEGKTSLSIAHLKAKSNNFSAESAYGFKEGQGGASGSFSVGAMPGQCGAPKGNTLFPELMKAAFELEIALRPDREPSSTIAINRNAQFRPHVDNGAGAGQSRSLIVGLGTYAGGELVVEGDKHDIRYKAIEFNGWTQRHWTMPFEGERYSLVWFTPKGCEGVHGIDIKIDT